MTQFIAKIAVITGLAVSLSGCAQIGLVGDNLWGFTKSTAHFVTKPVTGLLRSAPRHDYVFDQDAQQNLYVAQHQVKTALANDGTTHPRSQLDVPNLKRLPQPQTQNYRHVMRTPSYEHQSILAGKIPRRIVRQPRPIVRQASHHIQNPVQRQSHNQVQRQAYLQPTPQQQAHAQDDISFVKIGGGSDMKDWKSCQQSAGNYFQMTDSGYRIDPNFENCMRSKGYKPENEAQADLNL